MRSVTQSNALEVESYYSVYQPIISHFQIWEKPNALWPLEEKLSLP